MKMDNLFVTLEEAQAHMAALRLIAEADGVVTENERLRLDALAALYASNFEEFPPDNSGRDLPELLKAMQSRKSKMALLQDLLAMAFIDNDWCEREDKKIQGIAEALEVPSEEYEKLRALNVDVFEASKRLAQFLFQATN